MIPALPPPGVVSVFAHQGGWDELLLVGGPILLIGGLLALANRRAARMNDEDDTAPSPPSTSRS